MSIDSKKSDTASETSTSSNTYPFSAANKKTERAPATINLSENPTAQEDVPSSSGASTAAASSPASPPADFERYSLSQTDSSTVRSDISNFTASTLEANTTPSANTDTSFSSSQWSSSDLSSSLDITANISTENITNSELLSGLSPKQLPNKMLITTQPDIGFTDSTGDTFTHPVSETSTEATDEAFTTVPRTTSGRTLANALSDSSDTMPSDSHDTGLTDTSSKPLNLAVSKNVETTSNKSMDDTHAIPSKTSPISKEKPTTGFFAEHPLLSTPPTMPAGISTRIFTTMSYAPWLFLTAILALQTIFYIDVRALWFSDEIRHAAVFKAMLTNGKWFALELNGEAYPDKPSLYFWFLRGLYEIVQEEGPRLYLGAATICATLYLWASLALGRIVGRFDGRSLLASGILLLSCGYFIGVTHYARMDLLFSFFIICSHIAFFVAWSKPRATLSMLLAFTFGGLACITKGPLGIAFPLATSLFFLLWRGKLRRFFAVDTLIGFICALAITGAWLAGLFMETSLEYIQTEILGGQIVQRAVDATHHSQKWAYYCVRLPLLLAPWVIFIFCLPYHKVFSKNARTSIMASRTPEREGIAFLWCMILSALIMLSLVSTKILIYMLPILPAFTLLAGRAILQLAGKNAALFRLLTIFTLFLGGTAVIFGGLAFFGSIPIPEGIRFPNWQMPFNMGLIFAGITLLVAALALLLLVRSSRPENILLILAVTFTVLTYPIYKMAIPALDAYLSPIQQAGVIKAYADAGYTPFTYKVYGGTYTYYSGHNTKKLNDFAEIVPLLENQGKVVVALRQKHLDTWADKPECLQEIHRQWIETYEYILLACPSLVPEVQVPFEAEPREAGNTHGTDELQYTDETTEQDMPLGAAPSLNRSTNTTVNTSQNAPSSRTLDDAFISPDTSSSSNDLVPLDALSPPQTSVTPPTIFPPNTPVDVPIDTPANAPVDATRPPLPPSSLSIEVNRDIADTPSPDISSTPLTNSSSPSNATTPATNSSSLPNRKPRLAILLPIKNLDAAQALQQIEQTGSKQN